jgi:hypothetical protein
LRSCYASHCVGTQTRIQRNYHAQALLPAPQGSFGNGHLAHIFQADGLNTKLNAIPTNHFALATLVLDRNIPFAAIGLAEQFQQIKLAVKPKCSQRTSTDCSLRLLSHVSTSWVSTRA